MTRERAQLVLLAIIAAGVVLIAALALTDGPPEPRGSVPWPDGLVVLQP